MALAVPFGSTGSGFSFNGDEESDSDSDEVCLLRINNDIALLFQRMLSASAPEEAESQATIENTATETLNTDHEDSSGQEMESSPLVDEAVSLVSGQRDVVEEHHTTHGENDNTLPVSEQHSDNELKKQYQSVDNPSTNVSEVPSAQFAETDLPPCLLKTKMSNQNKKRPSRTERHQRKERVARKCDLSEFGFNFSRNSKFTSLHPAEECKEDDINANATSTPAEDSVDSVKEGESTNLLDCIDLDDEAYFAHLGIDVNDSGGFYVQEDFLDWDGIRVSTPDQHSTANKQNAPKSHRRNDKSHSTTKQNTTCKNTLSQHSFHKVDLPNCRLNTREKVVLFDSEIKHSQEMYLRRDRDRRVEKVHKSIKTKHFRLDNIRNNIGRKRIYVHHRLLKKTGIDLDFRYACRPHSAPMSKQNIDLTVARAICARKNGSPWDRVPKAQNLRYALHESNLPSTFEHDLASYLLSIQNRDLTPEDYEMLLRLDDTVAAKTVSKNVLNSLKTETVGADIAGVMSCVICMEFYKTGDVQKFLPCGHAFHVKCIDSWLANSSPNCPLDGLSIDPDSHDSSHHQSPTMANQNTDFPHVLHETNLPLDLELDLANDLLSIQTRDVTPEDYDILLQLDDTVATKTVSENLLESLKTETVAAEIVGVSSCVICMEIYKTGDERKFLPCGHDFHVNCIDSWLTNSSQNCPLDGLSIDPDSIVTLKLDDTMVVEPVSENTIESSKAETVDVSPVEGSACNAKDFRRILPRDRDFHRTVLVLGLLTTAVIVLWKTCL